jgi:hypothetical protein
MAQTSTRTLRALEAANYRGTRGVSETAARALSPP